MEKEARLREIGLYGVIALVSMILLFSFFLYRNKIGRLHLKNSLIQQEAKQREAELHLQNRIMESELKVMRTQMNPHFIFNVLNNIESYVLENDRKTASRLIQKFAKLSRLILENSTHNMVPLERDWMALRLYIELEALRFDGQFQCIFHADEKLDLDNLLVPPMLIQPLVENAIYHGLRASTRSDKLLEVSVKKQEGYLVFLVRDNGVGFSMAQADRIPTAAYKQKSLGLASIRERLELFNLQSLPSKPANLVIQETQSDGMGTTVTLFFPVVEENVGSR